LDRLAEKRTDRRSRPIGQHPVTSNRVACGLRFASHEFSS
jgi:hypothetical protein